MRKISKNIQNKKIITFNFYKRKTYLFYLKLSRQMISYFVIRRILNIDPFDIQLLKSSKFRIFSLVKIDLFAEILIHRLTQCLFDSCYRNNSQLSYFVRGGQSTFLAFLATKNSFSRSLSLSLGLTFIYPDTTGIPEGFWNRDWKGKKEGESIISSR